MSGGMSDEVVDIMDVVVRGVFRLTEDCEGRDQLLGVSQEDTVIDLAILCL